MKSFMEQSRIETLPPAERGWTPSPLPSETPPFEKLLATAAASALIVDGEGRIVWMNRKTEELFGYRRQELLGQAVEVLVPERFREAHRQKREGFLRSPRNRAIGQGAELTARRRDGSEFPVEVSLSYAGSGENPLVMVLVADISPRRRMEKALEQSEALHRKRIERLEAELHLLEQLAERPASAVTARHLGLFPLRESAPPIFEEMVAHYRGLLETALEAHMFKTEENTSESLRALAARLGFLKADPRDVIDLHSTALKKIGQEKAAPKVRGYVAAGHLLLVELMGYLASYYRNAAPREVEPRD